MPTFATCIRKKRGDGLYPVYVRVSHNYGLQYINPGMFVSEKGLRKTYTKTGKEVVDIIDKIVLKECIGRISKYAEKCNLVCANDMDCKMLVDVLTDKGCADLSFTDYARRFFNDMINRDREKPASNYEMAIKRLREFVGKENIFFKELTSKLRARQAAQIAPTTATKPHTP